MVRWGHGKGGIYGEGGTWRGGDMARGDMARGDMARGGHGEGGTAPLQRQQRLQESAPAAPRSIASRTGLHRAAARLSYSTSDPSPNKCPVSVSSASRLAAICDFLLSYARRKHACASRSLQRLTRLYETRSDDTSAV